MCVGKECFICKDWWQVFGHFSDDFFFVFTLSPIIGGWKACVKQATQYFVNWWRIRASIRVPCVHFRILVLGKFRQYMIYYD